MKERRGGVYVHCRRGRVRCVMMCTAFVMVTSGLDLLGAEGHVLNAHPFGKLRKAHRQVLHALYLAQTGPGAQLVPDFPAQHVGVGGGWGGEAVVRDACGPARGADRERAAEVGGVKAQMHKAVMPVKVPDCLSIITPTARAARPWS